MTSSFSAEELLERVVRFLDRAKFGDAQRLAEQALRRSSHSADCHYALGLVLTQLDRIPEADRALLVPPSFAQRTTSILIACSVKSSSA